MDCVITNGKTYIMLNDNGTPVICVKNMAQRFTSLKANNILKMLPKTMSKFHFKVVVMPEIKPNNQLIEIKDDDLKEVHKTVITETRELSESITTWLDKVSGFNGLIKDATCRKVELSQAHSEIEKQKLDIEHEVEFNKGSMPVRGIKHIDNGKIFLNREEKLKMSYLFWALFLKISRLLSKW